MLKNWKSIKKSQSGKQFQRLILFRGEEILVVFKEAKEKKIESTK
jgi:hypothetical protein